MLSRGAAVGSATEHVRLRFVLTLLVAFSHLMLAILAMLGRLTYSVPSQIPLLSTMMGNHTWMTLQLAAALSMIAALAMDRYQVTAVAASTGVMTAWSFLSLLWGLSTIESNPYPVSLAGPAMSGSVALLSYLLALSWARSGDSGSR